MRAVSIDPQDDIQPSFRAPNFGHPFMFANASTSDGGNDEKWDTPAVSA
jgi:hypothetical protein